MNHRKITLIVLLILTVTKMVSQPNYDYTFKKILKLPAISDLTSIKELPDKTFLIAGSFPDSTGTPYKAFISKISKNGTLLETHYYSIAGYDLEEPIIEVDNNGNIYMAIFKSPVGNGQAWSFVLLALSPTFNILWSKEAFNNGLAYVKDMTLQNGEILITIEDFNSYSVALKIDLSGNLIWSKLYTHYLTCGSSFFPNKNVFAGMNSGMPVITEFDHNGNLILNKKYTCDSAGTFNIWGINKYANLGYILCGVYDAPGTGNFNPVVIAIDSTGNFLWSNVYHTVATVGESWTIKPIYDGGYAVIYEPEHIYPYSGSNMGLFKIDSLGNPLWCRIYNISNHDFPTFNSLITTSDSGFALGGHITYNNNYITRPLFVKTDSLGFVRNCNLDTTLAITVTPLNFTVSAFGQADSTLLLQNISTTSSSLVIPDSIYCLDSVFVSNIAVTTSFENFSDNGISISPNPFTLQTTITFSEEQKNTTIRITDLIGKEITTINFTGRQLVIDKAEMKAGVYFVQTTDQQKRICNRKIIIQ